MKITVSSESPISAAVDVLVVGVRGKRVAQDPVVKRIDGAMKGALSRAIKDEGYKGGKGKQLGIAGSGRLKAKRVVLIGIDDTAPGPSSAALRVFAVRAGRAACEKASLALVAPVTTPEAVAALAEGVRTGAYRYSRYLTGDRKPKRELGRVALLLDARPTPAHRDAVGAGLAVGESVNLARDLVNCPANDLTATDLANLAAAESKRFGVACKVYNKAQIVKLGMPLLLAVNRGSAEEPRFIHMTYKPKGVSDAPRVVFVGKGLTFDSGGLCIKPAASMLEMKIDMAGAAATIGVVLAAARLSLPIEVHGVIGSTDNMTGGNAYRPGDVFPSRSGKTVEIINTDAEGRLVLADALAYASELEPDYIIDHATLTGACMIALGSLMAGLFSNDDAMRKAYEQASERSGESLWHLPLSEDMTDQLKSPIADLKHTGGRFGGAITAALFLREFVGDSKWAHVDIAGPAHLERAHGIHPRGATGFGVITALEFLRGLVALEG